MFFKEKGSLDGEFDALYASLFDKSDNYIKVVETLSTKNKGLTREEILRHSKLNNNGHFTQILQDLIDCEFIRSYKGYGKTVRQSIYQLIDPFTLFYFKFIKKNGVSDNAFWQYQLGTRIHTTWAGLAFEILCLNHRRQIEKRLGISGIHTSVYSWSATAEAKEGAQIDLIIKRADRIVNVCEMKYYDDIFVMKKKDKDDMERKLRSFKSGTTIKGALHPILVTTYGLHNNEHSQIFQQVITFQNLFEET